MSGRGRWFAAAAAGLAVAAVVAANLSPSLAGVFYDDGVYLALARSVAEGHGYRLLYLPGSPAAVHYPFLYPLVLAALWKLFPAFPANLAVLKAANAALMGVFAALLVLYLAPRTGWRAWLAALLVAAAATALPLVTAATVLLAEPLFLALLVAACWACDAARAAEPRRRAWSLAALAGILAGAAALTRSLGIVAVLAVPLSLALARRPRAAGVSAVCAVACLAPWVLWVARHRSGVDPAIVANYGSYTDLLAQAGWATLSPASLGALLSPLGAVALAPFGGWLRLLFGVPALALLVAGFAPLLRRLPALAWSLLGYLALVLAWPVRPDRFLWAAWPLLAVAFAAGAERVWRRAGGWRRRVAWSARWGVAAAAAAVVSGYGFYQSRGYARGDVVRLQGGISATLSELMPWVRSSTPPQAVVAAESEATVWLYTGRRAVTNYVWRYRGRGSESLGPDALHAWFERAGVTHVLVTGAGSEAAPTLNELLARYPGYLRVVRVWPGSALAFEVERGTPAGAAGGPPRGST